MRLNFSNERVLSVVAHPDDAELLCAGTLARAKADGAAIAICVLCQGDKGQPAEPIENLGEIRRQEMQAATQVLGCDLFSLDVPDAALTDDPPTRAALTAVLREFRPSVLLGHAPTDYHADHQAASRLVEACSWLCASRGQPIDGRPLDAPPELWWMDTVGMQQFEPAFYVDVSDHVALKEQMLQCHSSQIDRSGDADFAPLLELMRSQTSTRGRQSGVDAAEAFRPHHAFKRSRAW